MEGNELKKDVIMMNKDMENRIERIEEIEYGIKEFIQGLVLGVIIGFFVAFFLLK